jgi:hypothetical protein
VDQQQYNRPFAHFGLFNEEREELAPFHSSARARPWKAISFHARLRRQSSISSPIPHGSIP